jgi:large subunit ribosomal protein L29
MRENLNEMNIGELKELEEKLHRDYRVFRFNKLMGQLENTLKVRETRRKIARVKTLLHEFELGIRKKIRDERS